MLKIGDRIVIPGQHDGRHARSRRRARRRRRCSRRRARTGPSRRRIRSRPPKPSSTARVAASGTQATAEAAPTRRHAKAPTFRWPVRGRVISGFGPKPNGQHNDGIDLAVPEGTAVRAAEDGVVAYAGSELKGYGNLILIRHANGFVTAYAHASEIMVKRNDTVQRGQVIAKSGQTGSVTSPQLHFEIRKGSTPVDPAQFLPIRRLIAAVRGQALAVAQRDAEPSGEILHELPGDASGARAARRRPFERLAAQRLGVDRKAEMRRRSPRPWRGTRPGCSGESRATGRSGRTATPSPRPSRPD